VQDMRDLCRIEGVRRSSRDWMILSLELQKADWHLPSVPAELLATSGKAMLWECLIRWAARHPLPHIRAVVLSQCARLCSGANLAKCQGVVGG
jgi:hypothetical protein